MREPFVTKSLGQNCSLLGMKTKCNFATKHLILHIKFPKFSLARVLWEGRPPPAPISSMALGHVPGEGTPFVIASV